VFEKLEEKIPGHLPLTQFMLEHLQESQGVFSLLGKSQLAKKLPKAEKIASN